eukprot:6947580-Prymnesium_polylepis.2
MLEDADVDEQEEILRLLERMEPSIIAPHTASILNMLEDQVHLQESKVDQDDTTWFLAKPVLTSAEHEDFSLERRRLAALRVLLVLEPAALAHAAHVVECKFLEISNQGYHRAINVQCVSHV